MSPRKALTAAAVILPQGIMDRMPRTSEAWQEQAWKLWRTVGVLHYPTSFMADQVARVNWDVTIGDDQLDPEKSADEIKAATHPHDPNDVTRRIALNLEVAGEIFYVYTGENWKTVSATHPRRAELLRDAQISVRVWLSDPVDFEKADSPVRAAVDVAEEIRVIQTLSRVQTRNRVAQRGILLHPSEAEFPDGDPFSGDFQKMMTAPISDEYDVSAVVPPALKYPGDRIEQWRHLVLDSPYDDKLQERLDNAIRRLALSLNMPPEVLLGVSDVNHWNAWISEESTYRAHVEPLAHLTGQVFAKAMQAVLNRDDIQVTPDPSELLARRQSVSDSFRAFELGVVNADYVRRAIGADDDDAAVEPPPVPLSSRRRVAPGTGNAPVGPPSSGPVSAAVNGDTPSEEALDRLARQLSDLDMRMLAVLEGLAESAVVQARQDREPEGAQERIAGQMEQLGALWSGQVDRGRVTLTNLGIDASGPLWDEAQAASVALLVDGMTDYVTTTLDRTDSAMPATPILFLRQVLATAGGSGTATVAALPPANPSPTFQDPRGFGVGVLTLRDLDGRLVKLVQWRFRYGAAPREHPFLEHQEVDGQFMTADGETSEGWYPGDHRGCLCWSDPVFREVPEPEEV